MPINKVGNEVEKSGGGFFFHLFGCCVKRAVETRDSDEEVQEQDYNDGAPDSLEAN